MGAPLKPRVLSHRHFRSTLVRHLLGFFISTTSATTLWVSASSSLLLCNIFQIATGLPYSESPRKTARSGPSLINIRCNLTCFRPVQSFDLLGWGGSSPHSALKNYTSGVGPVLTVLFIARAHLPIPCFPMIMPHAYLSHPPLHAKKPVAQTMLE
jgi:hypothetical protein